jgi:hypothetical protein
MRTQVPARRNRGPRLSCPPRRPSIGASRTRLQTTQPRPNRRPLEGRPVNGFGVRVTSGVPVDRENAPAPDARGAMGLPEPWSVWVNDRFITDR